MEEILACRACLATDTKLFNMYKNELINAYEILTGVQMSATDGLPHQMCSFCAALLMKCAVFQQKCRNTQQLLELALIHEQMITTDYIRNVDREAHQLTHPYKMNLNLVTIKQEQGQERIEEQLSSFLNNIIDNQAQLKLEEQNTSDEEPLSKIVKKRNVKKKKRKIKLQEIDDIDIKNEIDMDVPLFQDDFVDDDEENVGEKGDIINEHMEVITLTKEEQIEELQSRKNSVNYKSSMFKCEQCFKGFMTEGTFKNHMDRHDPARGALSCDICHIRWADRRTLQSHVLSTHLKKYVCRRCGHVSKSNHSAKEHYRWHEGVTYICDICGATFSKSTSHLTHVRTQHPSNNVCDICGESFVSANGLKMHRNKAHKGAQVSDIKVETKCVMCGTQFKNSAALQRHIFTNENGMACDPDLRPCLFCGDSFMTDNDLKEHYKLHQKDKTVKCLQCNRKFANGRSHAVHYQRVHLGVRLKRYSRDPAAKDVVCEICGKTCMSRATLVYHQRTHSGEKPYQCNECPKRFSVYQRLQSRATLVYHQRTHSGEKPYQCNECPKRFSVYQRLQIHMRTHTGERPFKCSQCPKAFKHKAALNRHNRVHTGAKPYQCPHCGKAFSQSNTMKTHVRTVHLKLAAPYRRPKHKEDCIE